MNLILMLPSLIHSRPLAVNVVRRVSSGQFRAPVTTAAVLIYRGGVYE